MANKYNPKYIEPKWRKFWEENPELYQAKDKDKSKKKYNLVMFPYPSGDGLHVGHVESYTATDIVSRYDRMNGKNVLQPFGFDAFGLPAENFAIKTGVHPAKTTERAIKNFIRQVKMIGASYDWSRKIDTSDPEYYRWTQWFFLLLYKHGLAYKKKAKVNWCDSCKTVLANEQVENGVCERCKNPVVQKDLEQWFFRITDFIEDKPHPGPLLSKERGETSGLLSGLDKVDWPESTRMAQRNWIGRSEGTVVKFKIRNSKHETNSRNKGLSPEASGLSPNDFLEVFTTRVDTIFGCTYVVVAPEHSVISEQRSVISNWQEVEKYIKESQKKSDLDRMEAKVKTGVEVKGIKAVNPFTGEEVPVYVADYVLGHYGTGAVMAVPAHDERDWEFARKYDLPIKEVLIPVVGEKHENEETRKTISAIIPDKEGKKFLMVYWNKFDWYSPSIGGIEEGETPEAAVVREVFEETGYKVKPVERIGGEIKMHFFAENKNVWRERYDQPMLCELIDEKQYGVNEEESARHKSVWLTMDEVFQKMSHKENLIGFERYRKNNYAYTDDGVLINSGEYSDLTSEKAREKMTKWLEKNKLGKKKINYKLRDWLVSRQRYWGAPIPIIYCDKCGEVSVSEKDLPVKLPTDVDFKPTGESPLKYSKSFQNVKCPKCQGKARRESDTMDTFVCSSWYYFRYADSKNQKKFADKKLIDKWLPVDLYVGGAEHSVLHLLYARFFTKVLHNLGYIDFDEPFSKLRHQGMILAEDGRKMSKSLGNVVNPDDEVKRFGADSLRLFEMFMGPLEDAKPWNTKGIIGVYRFLERVWKLQFKIVKSNNKLSSQISNNQFPISKINTLVHKTIKKVTADIEAMRFNTAISSLMILTNELEKEESISITNYQLLITLLSPFAPFISEEIWNQLGHKDSIFRETWPQYDPKKICDEEIELVVQINGKVRDRIKVSAAITEEEAKKKVLESDKIKTYISGKKIRKIIFVKGRLINIVV